MVSWWTEGELLIMPLEGISVEVVKKESDEEDGQFDDEDILENEYSD